MGVEIVHHQHDSLSVCIVLIDQPLYHVRPVHLRATLSDLYPTPPVQRGKQHEQTAHSIALVFVVVGRHRAGRCGTRHSRLLDLLFARLIHAHQNFVLIIRPLVDFQHVFHRAHKLRALTGRDAPTLLQPRLEFVFFKHLANRFGADGLDYLTLDQLVSQQLQGPTGATLRRFPAGHRYQPGFALAVQYLLTAAQLLFAVQRRLDAFLHTAPAHPLDH